MLIKRLELQGFKSFPEKTKVIIHPGITVIVGPNGTGKSNIVDSLLWVLGGKRFKALKGEGRGEFIFNGNNKMAPLNMADVSLVLEDESEELVINHRIFRSGESEYRMNGKVARLKDIQDALWKKAIGETEYFVIEQGNIGVFLTSKPIEKRALLEEAAGTAYYKDKKRQTQNKLENSEQNLIRLEDIIDEVSKAKNSLKRQAHAAIRYRKLRENIRELTLFSYRKKIEKIESSHAELSSLYTESLNQEKQIMSRLKDEEKNLAERRKELWVLEKSLKEEQEKLYSQRTLLSRLETEKEKEEKNIDFLEERKKSAHQNRSELAQELITQEKEKTENESNLEIFAEDLNQRQKDLNVTLQANQAYQQKLKARQSKIETLREKSLQTLSLRTESKNEAAKLEKELELTLLQEEKLKSQLGSEESSFQKIKDDLSQSEKETRRLKGLIEKKQEELKTNQLNLQKAESTINSLQDQFNELTGLREKDILHLHALEKIEEKEKGADISSDIPQALGLLVDSIETDPKDAYLVDVFWKDEAKATLVHAQDFLDNLAKRELKGNFILLSPQKKEALSSKAFQDKRVIGLLKSHIRSQPKIKEALPQLNEAAIVQDIKSAVELWLHFPSINCITIKGDLLFQSGLLKLGPKKEGILTLRQEIKKLKENIALKEKKISPLDLQINKETTRKNQLEEKTKQDSEEISSLEDQIKEKLRRKNYSHTEQEKIKTHIDILEKEFTILSAEIQALTRKQETVLSRIKGIEEKEDNLKEQMEEEEESFSTLQGKNERERKQSFTLQSNVDILKEKIRNLKTQIQANKQRKKNTEARIISLDREILAADKEKNESKENIQRFDTQASKLREEKKEIESQLTQDEVRLRILQNEQKEIEEKIERMREEYESQKEERVQREIRKAETERDLVNLEESCWQENKKTLKEVKKEISIDEIAKMKVEESLEKSNEDLQKYKTVNLMAEEEYLIQEKRYDFLTQQRADLHESIDSTKQAIKKIDQESKTQFMKALNEVNKYFKEIFSLLFEGGDAEVKLTDPDQPLDSGVEIAAQPPGKKIQSLNLLSGGEKSLTSLAFFFALFRYKPIPFCVLDEIDAALDETNLLRFLNLMKKIKNQTQFILITHNFKTMEVADYIYGTTMAEPNVTNIYSLKLKNK